MEAAVPDAPSELQIIANKLEIINQQLAKQRENRRRLLQLLFIAVALVSGCVLLGNLISIAYNPAGIISFPEDLSVIGGSDGPTAIFVTSRPPWILYPWPSP